MFSAKPVLTYFDARGVIEPTRIMFSIKNVDFTVCSEAEKLDEGCNWENGAMGGSVVHVHMLPTIIQMLWSVAKSLYFV